MPHQRRRAQHSAEGHAPTRRRAIATALLVTFLWSTSWVLIKRGLPSIPPLTFAGLRYAIAFLCLSPMLWRRRREVLGLRGPDLALVALLGLVLYTVTQGGQFLTLAHLEATTFSLVLSMTAVLVAGFSLRGHEPPRAAQLVGIALAAAGAVIYFVPSREMAGSALGFVLAGITLAANAAASLLGRAVNRRKAASPIVVTAVSMGIGAVTLLAVGRSTEPWPHLALESWVRIGWLATVNTALAFTLWNRTLRVLSAVESSVINNTMLVQIALLAWLFLGETKSAVEVAGLALVAVGTVLVQVRGTRFRFSRRPPGATPAT